MRQRRVERCLLKADVALEAGFPADAREALDEARALNPLAPELADLERRVTALENTVAAGREPAAPRGRRLWLPLVVAGLFLAALGVMNVWLRPVELRPLVPADVAPALAVPLAASDAPAASVPMLTVAIDRVTAAEIQPHLEPLPVGTSASAAADQVPAFGTAAPTPVLEETTSRLESRSVAPTPLPLSPRLEPPRAELPLETRAVAPVDDLPVTPAPPRAVAEPATAPTAASAPAIVREDERVRAVLARYEAAYSALDAGAADAVYPRIDRAKLARAFEALEAQQVSLGSCSIQVGGFTANAECAGSATWTPKVGGGARTQARRWRFELRRAGEGWQIVEATVR